VIVSLFDRGTGDSTLLVAVSASGDPMGTWKRFRVPVGGTIVTFLDFTRMALTRDAIVISANVCGQQYCAQQADLFIIQKTDAYNAAHPVPLARFQFNGPYDLIPITVHGDDPTVRFLAEDAVNVVVYEVQRRALVKAASFPLSAVLNFDWGTFQTQIGPQMGSTSTIDVGWPTLQYAVERNGVIWIVESIIHNARSSIAWYRLHLPLSSSSAVDKGLIDDLRLSLHRCECGRRRLDRILDIRQPAVSFRELLLHRPTRTPQSKGAIEGRGTVVLVDSLGRLLDDRRRSGERHRLLDDPVVLNDQTGGVHRGVFHSVGHVLGKDHFEQHDHPPSHRDALTRL